MEGSTYRKTEADRLKQMLPADTLQTTLVETKVERPPIGDTKRAAQLMRVAMRILQK